MPTPKVQLSARATDAAVVTPRTRKKLAPKPTRLDPAPPPPKPQVQRVLGYPQEVYDAILKLQGNTCKNCAGPLTPDMELRMERFKDTGRIYGIICDNCP